MTPEEFRDLMFLWHEYAMERDRKLTKGAIYLKNQVLEFVGSLPVFREIPPKESKNELTPEEIADIEASEKEIKEGKCKTFKTVKELLEDLHSTRSPDIDKEATK